MFFPFGFFPHHQKFLDYELVSYINCGTGCKLKMWGTLFKNLRVSRWQQESIKSSAGPFEVWDPVWPYKSHTHKPSPVPSFLESQSRSLCRKMSHFKWVNSPMSFNIRQHLGLLLSLSSPVLFLMFLMLYLEIEQCVYFGIVRIFYVLLPFRFLSLILVFKKSCKILGCALNFDDKAPSL